MRAARFIASTSSAVTGVLTAVVVATLGTASLEHRAEAAGDAGASSLPACIAVATEARWVPYGYNHIVLLKNGCSKAATCSVSTDVNPQATSVDVAAAASVEVLTFTASPAQTFHANVTCKLH